MQVMQVPARAVLRMVPWAWSFRKWAGSHRLQTVTPQRAQQLLVGCLLCARHFIHTISFSPHTHIPVRQVWLLSPLKGEQVRGSMTLQKLARGLAEMVHGETRLGIPVRSVLSMWPLPPPPPPQEALPAPPPPALLALVQVHPECP